MTLFGMKSFTDASATEANSLRHGREPPGREMLKLRDGTF